ncbi:TRAP transporter large permease [Aeromicrobium phragmitis]|uniref:TRAP transporter large permease n=1 Tax=Aeromicrobium phragmitis TaxID=2478914 RepID=A0A3L8PP29_9ACTN|nr:TRAP transporter large permease [Aeromicrobium phragmitis]RLV57137.1 TRAP transporter large permease [Aeromicrobium phragmitis]
MPIAAFVVLALIVLGVAVAVAFGMGALIFFMLLGGNPGQVPSVAFRTLDSFTFLAIPFFLLAGAIMQSGGVSKRLIEFVGLIAGRFKGGLGATMIGACALFGSISGSSVATVSAIGRIMSGEMAERGYPKKYLASLVAVSGIIGILIPPSVPIIVYAVAAGVSIADMFLAGAVIGILLTVVLVTFNFVWARGRDLDDLGARLNSTQQRRTARRIGGAVPALIMPVIILGGIYSGIFTPTESGAVACAYGLFVGLLVYRELKPSGVGGTVLNGLLATAPILLIIAMGGAFARAVVVSGVPQALADTIGGWGVPAWVLLIVLNLMLFVVGMFIEENTAIVILVPLLLPLTAAYGIDPVQFGIIMVLNLGMGLATPPFAPNLFVAANATATPFHTMVLPALRLLVTCVLPVLVVVNVVPALTTFMR